MSSAAEVVSKGDFARLRNVSPGRVSQWIAEGKITAAALVGEGRFARIRVAVATDQLRERLDLGQLLGNGIATDLTPADVEEDVEPIAGAGGSPKPPSGIDHELRLARLEEIRRRNRLAEREELAERGVYMPTDEARSAMTAMAASMLTVFEGGLAAFASALSAKYALPERDLLHLLRTEFRAIRVKAAEAARRKAQAVEPVIDHDPEADQAQPAAA